MENLKEFCGTQCNKIKYPFFGVDLTSFKACCQMLYSDLSYPKEHNKQTEKYGSNVEFFWKIE